jgi:hypothetical protein
MKSGKHMTGLELQAGHQDHHHHHQGTIIQVATQVPENGLKAGSEF